MTDADPAAPTAPGPTATERPPSLIGAAVVYATLFGAVGAYFPYIAVFLGSIGLDLAAVGALIAVHSAVSLVAAPAWGALADRLRDVRGPLLVAGLGSAVAAAWLAIAREPLGVGLAIVLLAAGTAGMAPLVDSRTVELVGSQRERFGRARAPGSAAFIVVSIATGILLERATAVAMFWLYVPLLAIAGLAAWLLLGRRATRRGAAVVTAAGPTFSLATLLAVLGRPVLGRFFVGSVVLWAANAAITTFLSVHVVAIGGDIQLAGLVWSLGALIEVPLMLVFPTLSKRFGAERLLVIGALAMALRAAGYALAPAPLVLLAVAPLGGLGFALFYVGTVTFVARAAPREVQATAQGIFSGTAFSLGSILGSVVGGVIAQATSLPILFGLSAGAAVAAGLVIRSAVGVGGAEGSPRSPATTG